MDVCLGAVPAEVDKNYVHFFWSWGIFDKHKLCFLSRMLGAFEDTEKDLCKHLAPGGAKFVAIRGMCEADIPMDAPQHR